MNRFLVIIVPIVRLPSCKGLVIPYKILTTKCIENVSRIIPPSPVARLWSVVKLGDRKDIELQTICNLLWTKNIG